MLKYQNRQACLQLHLNEVKLLMPVVTWNNALIWKKCMQTICLPCPTSLHNLTTYHSHLLMDVKGSISSFHLFSPLIVVNKTQFTIIQLRQQLSNIIMKTHVRGFFDTDLHEVSWHFATHEAVRPSGFKVQLTEWRSVSKKPFKMGFCFYPTLKK